MSPRKRSAASCANSVFRRTKIEEAGIWSTGDQQKEIIMRTFVISDAHGYPELIQNALDHGGFQPGEDAFVYAGDMFDRGPDPEGCIDLVERYATEVLMGNHDVAVLLDFVVYPQDPENRGFRPLLIDKVLNAEPEVAWKVATCVEGVLITHAGVSSEYEGVLREECQGDPAASGRAPQPGLSRRRQTRARDRGVATRTASWATMVPPGSDPDRTLVSFPWPASGRWSGTRRPCRNWRSAISTWSTPARFWAWTTRGAFATR